MGEAKNKYEAWRGRLNVASLNVDGIRGNKKYNELITRLITQENRYRMYSRDTKRWNNQIRISRILYTI